MTEQENARTPHARLHHLGRTVFWLAVTVALVVLLFHYVNQYVSDPMVAALVGMMVGLWLRDPLLNYCNHAIGVLFPGSYANGQ